MRFEELFDDLLKTRRSVRNFQVKEIPDYVKNRLFKAAISGPSGGNIQPITVIEVQDKESKISLSKILDNQPWIATCPLSMIFCVDFYRIKIWSRISKANFESEKSFLQFLTAFIDVICAAENVVLIAEVNGLSSVYAGTILTQTKKVRKLFHIPQYVLPMICLNIGYASYIPSKVPKLTQEAIIHHEKYNKFDEDKIRAIFHEKYGDFNLENVYKNYLEALEINKQLPNSNLVEKINKQIKTLNVKNFAQFLFSYRYISKGMVALNKKIFRDFCDAGFDFTY